MIDLCWTSLLSLPQVLWLSLRAYSHSANVNSKAIFSLTLGGCTTRVAENPFLLMSLWCLFSFVMPKPLGFSHTDKSCSLHRLPWPFPWIVSVPSGWILHWQREFMWVGFGLSASQCDRAPRPWPHRASASASALMLVMAHIHLYLYNPHQTLAPYPFSSIDASVNIDAHAVADAQCGLGLRVRSHSATAIMRVSKSWQTTGHFSPLCSSSLKEPLCQFSFLRTQREQVNYGWEGIVLINAHCLFARRNCRVVFLSEMDMPQ